MAIQIGIVKALVGTATATANDGTIRNLQIGDQVFADELITTGAGSAIELEFADGSIMDLGRNSQAVLDDTVFNPEAATAVAQSTDAEVDAIQAALLAGADPTQVGEATAAGAGVEGGNEGHPPVVVDYLAPQVTPDSGFDTTGIGIAFPDIEQELQAPIEDGPVVSVSVHVEVQIDPDNPSQTNPPTDGIPTLDYPVLVNGNAASILEGTNGGENGETRDVTFILSLDKVFSQNVIVTYQLIEGTALFGTDQDWFDGDLINTVTIPAGTTTFPVTITIVQDHFDESNEHFSIKIIDAVNATINPAADTATVTIFDDDTTPVALDDFNAVTEDGGEGLPETSGNVISGENDAGNSPVTQLDTDQDGDSLIIVSFSDADENVAAGGTITGKYGELTLNSDGSYTYVLTSNEDPAIQGLGEGATLTDTFSYIVTDTFNAEQTATLTITIKGTNDGPVAIAASGDGLEDSVGITVMLSAIDVDGTVESFVIKSLPENGTLFIGTIPITLNMAIDATGGSATVTFVPDADWSDNNGDGSVTFNYVAIDNDGVESTEATATVKVTPVTDTPTVELTLTQVSNSSLYAADLSNVLNDLDGQVGNPPGFTVTALRQEDDGSWVETEISVKDTGSPTGFGVAGNGGSNGADSELENGEKLLIELDAPATSVTFQLSWLNSTNETAEYTLTYDNGTTQTFVITGGSDRVDPPVTIAAPEGLTITAIEFATPNEGNRVTTSDYLVHTVSYDVASTTYSVDITATPIDTDFSESITHLIVTTPEGVTLSNSQLLGTEGGISTWQLLLTGDNSYIGPTVQVDSVTGVVTVSGLTLTVPSDYDGALTVTAIATAYDPDAASPVESSDSETVTISSPPDNGVSITVSDDALIVDEDDLPIGSDTTKESTTQEGTFTISALDGVASLTVAGVEVISGVSTYPVEITTDLGNTLLITDYDASTGVVSYSYTLEHNETHALAQAENSLSEVFSVRLEDSDGDVATASLTVNIIDDIATISFVESTVVDNVAATFTGDWIYTAGADQLAASGINVSLLNQPDLIDHWSTIDVGGDTVLTAYLDAGETETFFNLTMKQDGTYTFELVNPNPTTTVTETVSLLGSVGGNSADLYVEEIAAKKGNPDPATDIKFTSHLGWSGGSNLGTADTVNTNNNGIGAGSGAGGLRVTSTESLTLTFLAGDADTVGATHPTTAKGVEEVKLTFDVTKGDGTTNLHIITYDEFGGVLDQYDTAVADGGVITVTNTGEPIYAVTVVNSDTNGGQFLLSGSETTVTETTLPDDLKLDFNVEVIDSDGDSSNYDFSIAIDTDGALTGTSADDAILGTSADDILIGGLGDDLLTGGLGADEFVWNEGETGTDTITDFNGGDKLNLADLLDPATVLDIGGTDSLDDYLKANFDAGTNTTTIDVYTAGDANAAVGTIEQSIVINGDVSDLNSLLATNNLIVDQ